MEPLESGNPGMRENNFSIQMNLWNREIVTIGESGCTLPVSRMPRFQKFYILLYHLVKLLLSVNVDIPDLQPLLSDTLQNRYLNNLIVHRLKYENMKGL